MQTGPEIQAFREARRLARSWRDHPGVQDIFYGTRYRRGRPTRDLSIRFHVREKLPLRAMDATERIPKRIGPFTTDVTASRNRLQVRETPPFSEVRPLLGGIQIQSAAYTQPLEWGTLGCVLQVKSDWFAITNHHVMFDEQPRSGLVIRQPKSASFGQPIGVSSIALSDAAMDYALFKPTKPFDRQQFLNGVPGQISGYKQAGGLNQLRLFKTGAASGLTHGIFDGRSLLNAFRVSIRRDPGQSATKLSAPGDSGSVWATAGDQTGLLKLFALHTGGDDDGELAYATLFSSIMPSLNAKLNNL